jgi:hypothetical protein
MQLGFMEQRNMATHWCYYCDYKSVEFSDIIDHNIVKHSDTELNYRQQSISNSNNIMLQSKNFHIVSSELKKEGKYIISDKDTYHSCKNVSSTRSTRPPTDRLVSTIVCFLNPV